ncbi:MAG: 50S ribosomal protein L4 [Acidobacteriota bacterium]|jgi:large subunit ribosomal protein L4|nr:50S ribosomal protein L4 [Acidobacteriota bacterium]
MAEIEVKNLANEVVGKLELSDDVFKAKFNEPLIWEAIKHYNDSLRAGTASTKVRGEVSGSGKKLWKQKGTGRARVGSVRSPLWRHGGTVHGPKPRDYSWRLPRKKLRGALRSALSAKLNENAVTVVEGLTVGSHKTKEFVKILNAIGLAGKVLVVDATADKEQVKNLLLSVRNLPTVKLVPGNAVNIFDVVNSNAILFSKDAILQVQEVLSR